MRFLGRYGGGAIMAPPIKIAPECPRKLKLGTQVLKGILKKYLKYFFAKNPTEKKSRAPKK